MGKHSTYLRSLAIAASLACFALPVHAEEPTVPSDTAALEDRVNALDSEFFGAFNRCDLPAMAALLDEDMEFFHDKGGVTHGRERMSAMARERCERTETVLRREVVEGSRRVYPMQGYGAVQTGSHRFYLSEGGGPEQLIEIAQFMHLWHKTDDGWKITRAISYDHRAP